MDKNLHHGIRYNLSQFTHQLLQVLLVGLTIGMTRAVVPALAESDFGVPRNSFVLLSSFVVAFGLVKATMNFIAGRLSESIGRKKVLLLGWLAALPIPLMIWHAPTWTWIVAAMILLGVNQGLTWSMTQTAKLDITRLEERGLTLGLNEFSGYVGVALAGIITAYMAAHLGARDGLLIFGLTVIVLALVLTQVWGRDTRPWALAEAFHYQFKHTNRYEEVSKRIRLGSAIEGRDEKGIKKTVCAFLKILHPHGPPTDAEFEEYVAYATECRRRVKEQMNKRKPDDEFARINLSYFKASGEDVVVFCPESKDAPATQEPARRRLNQADGQPTEAVEVQPAAQAAPAAQEALAVSSPVSPASASTSVGPLPIELKEQHFTILYGDTGHSYESILGPYLQGAKSVVIEDPYIRLQHQIQNFVRFCETVLKAGTVKKISLITGYDDKTQLADIAEKLDELKQSLLKLDVELEVKLNPNIHDREIRLDNGWVVKIGRGLDFNQKPGGWFDVGATDLSLRKCLETKVDIFRG